MKLRRQHITSLAHVVAKTLQGIAGVTLRAPIPTIEERIAALVEENLAAERALDDEAQKLLQQQLRKIGGAIDETRAFQLIKKELAKQRGFIL